MMPLSQTKAGSFEPAVLLWPNLRVYQCHLRNRKSPTPPRVGKKKKSPERNGDYCNEVVEWATARGPAGGNTARNATISNI